MSYIRKSWLRLVLSYVVAIIFSASLILRSGTLFVAAFMAALVWIISVNIDLKSNFAATKFVFRVYVKTLRWHRRLGDKTRFWGILSIITIALVVVVPSDLPIFIKVEIIFASALFGVIMFMKSIRRVLDPSYENTVDEPKEPIVAFDIGPTEGDLTGRDSPTYLRDRVFSDRPHVTGFKN